MGWPPLLASFSASNLLLTHISQLKYATLKHINNGNKNRKGNKRRINNELISLTVNDIEFLYRGFIL